MSNKNLKLQRGQRSKLRSSINSIFTPPCNKEYKNRLANRALRRQGATKIVNGVVVTD